MGDVGVYVCVCVRECIHVAEMSWGLFSKMENLPVSLPLLPLLLLQLITICYVQYEL